MGDFSASVLVQNSQEVYQTICVSWSIKKAELPFIDTCVEFSIWLQLRAGDLECSCLNMKRVQILAAVLGCEVVRWPSLPRPKEHWPMCTELFVGFTWPEVPNSTPLLRGPDTNCKSRVKTSSASSILKHGKPQQSWNLISAFCSSDCSFILFPLSSRTTRKCCLILHIPAEYEWGDGFPHTSAIQKRGSKGLDQVCSKRGKLAFFFFFILQFSGAELSEERRKLHICHNRVEWGAVCRACRAKKSEQKEQSPDKSWSKPRCVWESWENVW